MFWFLGIVGILFILSLCGLFCVFFRSPPAVQEYDNLLTGGVAKSIGEWY